MSVWPPSLHRIYELSNNMFVQFLKLCLYRQNPKETYTRINVKQIYLLGAETFFSQHLHLLLALQGSEVTVLKPGQNARGRHSLWMQFLNRRAGASQPGYVNGPINPSIRTYVRTYMCGSTHTITFTSVIQRDSHFTHPDWLTPIHHNDVQHCTRK